MITVFKNGHIHTMNREMPFVTALAIEDNKIVYVGDDNGAKAFESGAKVVDLEGKMMIPGMYDAHCHPMIYAFLSTGIILKATMTKQDVVDEIAKYIQEHPDNECYFGQGYPEWVFDESGPKKALLDSICSDKPIFIMGNGGHEGWCNSKTLELLDIDHTPDPLPGYSYFRRDELGELTGTIVEIPAEEIIIGGLPWFNTESVTKNYQAMFDRYSSLGVTSFVDCGTLFSMLEDTAHSYVKGFEDNGQLKQRFNASFFVGDQEKLKIAVESLKKLNKEFDTDLFRIKTLKIINDGTVESETASMFSPYVSGATADPMVEGEALYAPCVEAAKAGFNLHIHGIGDRAVHETLMTAKRVREAGCYDTRIVNAHTQVIHPDDFALFGKYNVLANTTSVWHYYAPEVASCLGSRFPHQFEMVSMIKAGGRLTLGSDLPFDEMGNEPLRGIQMGVTRQLCDEPEMPVMPTSAEQLSVRQCLEAYTINSAYQTHMDDKLGSLEVGKYADLVVLERDLFEIPVQDIVNTKILLTMMNGKPTYQNEAFEF